MLSIDLSLSAGRPSTASGVPSGGIVDGLILAENGNFLTLENGNFLALD